MLTSEDREELRKGMRTTWIVWGAMMASLAVYIIVGQTVGNVIRENMGRAIPVKFMANILYGVAAVELVVAYLMRRFMLGVRSSGAGAKTQAKTFSIPYPPATARYLSAMGVSLALSESIGIYGFVLFLVGADFKTMYSFIVISAAAIFYFRPKFEELEQLAAAMKIGSQSTPPEAPQHASG
jgi:hypothetical protein